MTLHDVVPCYTAPANKDFYANSSHQTPPSRSADRWSQDQGRRMSLDRFDRAKVVDGFHYELNKGVVEVSDVPHPSHAAILNSVRNQLIVFQVKNPTLIHSVMGSNDSKILIEADQSERHPDVSVYLTPPPDGKDVWSIWIPAIVVEIVSKSSTTRDYETKPLEYLAFGIDEYWIVDPAKKQLTVMSRWRGTWKSKTYKATQKYSTGLLPNFSLDLKVVFAAK